MGEFFVGTIKFIFAILLLPLVLACGINFYDHWVNFPVMYGHFFKWGAGIFLLLFLFFYQFRPVYEFGQKIVAFLFKFASPFDQFLSHILPFYTILIFLSLCLLKKFFSIDNFDHYFLFFAGFTLTMHILCVALELQEQESSPFKPSYLLRMNFILILASILAVLFLDVIVGEFTFAAFLKSVFATVKTYYFFIFKKLFLPVI